MRKKIILPALMLAALSGQAQTQIEFSVQGLPDSSTVMVFTMNGSGGQTVFSQDIPSGGQFCYTMNCDTLMYEGTYFSVMAMKTGSMTRYGDHKIYLGKGDKVMVKGQGKSPERWQVQSNHPGQKFYEAAYSGMADLHEAQNAILAQMYQAGANVDSLRPLLSEIYGKMDNLVIDNLANIPVDDYWMDYFRTMCYAFEEDPESDMCKRLLKLYGSIPEEQRQTKTGKAITQKIYGKPVEAGDMMPDWDLYDSQGNLHRLFDYRGKTLILDFTSYFCGPCRMAVPFISYFYDKGHGGLEILSISCDAPSQFAKMESELKGSYISLNDRDGEDGIFAQCKVIATPSFYVVGPDGIVKTKYMGLSTEIMNIIARADGFSWGTKVERHGKSRIVSSPKMDTISSLFVIDKVELHPDSTVVEFVSFTPEYTFGSGSVIKCGGKEYKALKSSIGFDEAVRVKLGEASRVRAVFEPLPADAERLDFQECDHEGCFIIAGVEIPLR